MKKSLIAAVVCLGALVSYAAAGVNFDQGVDVQAAISEAGSLDIQLPAAKYSGISHYTRDCVRFSFGPSDNDMTSEKVWLRSTEYVRECHIVMQPGPNGTMVPVQHCYDRPGMTWTQSGQINLKARKLLPWERESFDVCLEGPWMRLYVNQAGYKYSAKRIGNYDVLYELTPQEKIAMKADENGLNIGEFSYADGKYTFKVNDVWAKEYAGEKVAINLDLYKDNPNWFDTYKGSKEFTFDVAEGYTMTFSEKDMVKPETPDTVNDFRGSKKFYLKWGFKRVGVISKDNFMKKGETPRVEI